MSTCHTGGPASPGWVVLRGECRTDGASRRSRAHILLSAMWGADLLLEVAVRLVVIYRASVDVANSVLSVISLGTSALLTAATILIGPRLAASWEQRSVHEG